MISLFNYFSNYRLRSIILYTLMFLGFFLVLITFSFLIYRNQATTELTKLNYDATAIESDLELQTSNLTTPDNTIGTVPDDVRELQQPTLISDEKLLSKYNMFSVQPSSTNWDLSLDKDQLLLPQDNIDLEYYDRWTSFYLDKKFLVDGISKLNKIYIPSIYVDSPLDALEINDVGDSTEYETPNKVVCYIPSTIESDKKNIWFFGHLESPLYGEGSIFKKLPEVPDILRSGEEVYVYFDDEYFMYKYKVVTSEVVHEDDLTLYDTDKYSLTLVTCVPKWVYDHRLVLTAELDSYAVK